MHRFKRLLTALFLTILSVIVLFSGVLAFFIVNPLGGKLLVRYFKEGFSSVGLMHVGRYEGTLQEGFVLTDVVIQGLSYFPDTVVRIQEIHVHLPLWDLPHADLKIFNARIYVPNSDPLVLTGSIAEGRVQANVYGKSLDLHKVFHFWPGGDISRDLEGFVAATDFTVQGPLLEPQITGTFLTDEIRYKAVLINNLAGKVHLSLSSEDRQIKVRGEALINSGLIDVNKTKLHLAPSQFIFKGDVLNPSVGLYMGSKVEDMDFHLQIKGPVGRPQMTITSDPPMPAENALQILFTNNAWSTSTSPFTSVNSSQLAQNFLNYTLEQDMESDHEYGLKTKLAPHLKLGGEIDKIPSQPGETNTYYSRKVNGEMDMSEHTSLNVSEALNPQVGYPSSSYETGQEKPETQVYLQYKKRF